jgi:putative flippase GtrA
LKKLKDALFILLPKLSTFKAPLRYFIVAAFGFCVDYSIYATFVTMSVNLYIATAAGFCVGSIVNVLFIRAYVFPDSRFKLCEDVLFTVGANGSMLALGVSVLWLLFDVLHINPYMAKLLSNGLTFVLNYSIRTIFFRKK